MVTVLVVVGIIAVAAVGLAAYALILIDNLEHDKPDYAYVNKRAREIIAQHLGAFQHRRKPQTKSAYDASAKAKK